jgi:carboxylate-amine ligase
VPNKKRYRLFEVAGVELEYMIVDRETLTVSPIADKLIFDKTGQYISDADNGAIAWSNELVNHVIELKTNGPASTLDHLAEQFASNVQEINRSLQAHGAMLLPTAAHPLMDPFTETVLWPHEYNEIYSLYDRIFDCRGHGWSNLQSTHINLPFHNDSEFAALHAAIRLLLPLIPAIAASSPMLDGRLTGMADARMHTYLHNQKKLPVLMGSLIPEAVFTEQDYQRRIFDPIKSAIQPYDHERVMDHHFLNSRGAIARFDRGAIEIRVIDIQECPAADLALVRLFVQVLKKMIAGQWSSTDEQQQWHEQELLTLFQESVQSGEKTVISNSKFLRTLGIHSDSLEAAEVWWHLFEAVSPNLPEQDSAIIKTILEKGTLSTRIRRRLPTEISSDAVRVVYKELATCLDHNRLFE